MAELRQKVLTGGVLDEAQREQLLLEHLPHVQHIARRIHFRLPPQVPLEDLVHAGILGLIDAVRKFDPNKNVRLKYYAEFRIRGAILDSLRQVDWSPRALRRKARRLEEAVSRCEARLGRDAADTEIAAELEISLDELQQLLRDLHGLSLGSIHAEENHASRGDGIGVGSGPITDEDDPFHCTLRSEMTGLLMQAMATLSLREREVMMLYHFRELSMKAIGVALGVGESRVSQIHSAGLSHLRDRLQELMGRKPVAERVESTFC
ncbi:MAG: FliA/WhiG family RNA polymerase sigma factor [Candidatus Acidiferrales bacterium]|jgi:RNA polymerase sigma factor for flagellar operon FliA